MTTNIDELIELLDRPINLDDVQDNLSSKIFLVLVTKRSNKILTEFKKAVIEEAYKSILASIQELKDTEPTNMAMDHWSKNLGYEEDTIREWCENTITKLEKL